MSTQDSRRGEFLGEQRSVGRFEVLRLQPVQTVVPKGRHQLPVDVGATALERPGRTRLDAMLSSQCEYAARRQPFLAEQGYACRIADADDLSSLDPS